MSDEIKEILDKLKDENNYQRDCNDGSAFKELFANEINLLLDYITNLQQKLEYYENIDSDKTIDKFRQKINREMFNLQEENKRLKEIVENLTTMTVCGDKKQIKNTAQYKLDIYKSRNEKAIELINAWLDCLNNDDIIIVMHNLENILKGEEK